MDIHESVKTWHQLVKSNDPAGLEAILDDSVVFHSPVVHTPQEGKEITQFYLTAAFHVLANDKFTYVREVCEAPNVILEFTTEIEGIQINGVDMIRFNEAGKIVDFKVMIRPLKAINLLHQLMASMLESMKKA